MENCELVGWLEKLDGKIDKISEKQAEIHIQTTKTNGRVTRLEERGKLIWIGFTFIVVTFISLAAIFYEK